MNGGGLKPSGHARAFLFAFTKFILYICTMAYDRKKIYDKALKLIKQKELIIIEDVIALLGMSRSTFYDIFPIKSNESNTIKEAIEENRVNIKSKLRRQMSQSNSSSDRIALYKLCGTDEERKRLSQSYIDHTTEGERINNDTFNIKVVDASEDEDDTDT